jgi:pimeloyl-ACP methyl ester carboxylesterase
MRIKETYNLGLNLFFFLYNLVASLDINEKHSESLLEWNPCYQALHCATLQVPMNPLDESSPNIGIFLVKYSPMAKQAEKTIFINPGGPGSSASDFVISSIDFLRQLFDDRAEIIGVDPRGVGQTHPIKCGSLRQFNGYKDAFKVFGVPFLPENPSEPQKLYFDSAHKLNAKLCDMNYGEFLSYTSTANVARDIDRVRQALGLEKVNFWGISYGGILGLTYANMYPQHTGRMIIDSVANPNAYFLTSIE